MDPKYCLKLILILLVKVVLDILYQTEEGFAVPDEDDVPPPPEEEY